MNYCTCPNCRTDNCPNAESYAAKSEHENDTFVIGDIIRLRKIETDLRSQLFEAERLVRFYSGEGRETRPDMVEWQALANKKRKTKAETARMGEIARAVEDEDMDAPERLEEIKNLRSQLSAQREEIKKLLAGLLWALEFVQEPEYFPGDGDRQWWTEKRRSILALAKPQPSQT